MTRRTLSEIRATCTKAARGNGCPWGLAEEAGMAAKHLQSNGLPGVEALAQLFETPRDCTGTDPHITCGIKALAAFKDDASQLPKGAIAAPLLLAAALLDQEKTWKLDWGTGHAIGNKDGIEVTGPIPQTAQVILSEAPATQATPATWHSREVNADAWTKLLAHAEKTYVPETDQSRAAGAGPSDAQDD